jgi:hypothetical protein
LRNVDLDVGDSAKDLFGFGQNLLLRKPGVHDDKVVLAPCGVRLIALHESLKDFHT